MADEQVTKLNFDDPSQIPSRPNDLPTIPDLSDTWDHKAFNKLPLKEQMSRLNGHFPGIESYTPMDYQNYRKKIGKPVNKELELKEPSLLDHAINFARPLIAGAAGSAVGTAVGAGTRVPSLATAAGGGTYAATDALLQHLQSSPPENLSSSLLEKIGLDDPISRTLANTGESALIGKIGGKLLNPIFKGAGGIIKNTIGGTASEEAFQALNPTYSQYYKAVTGKAAPISKWVEDTFNNSTKAKLFTNAANYGSKELSKIAEKSAGGSIDDHLLSQDIADNMTRNLHRSTKFSDTQNGIISNIAKGNTHVTPTEMAPLPKDPVYTPLEKFALEGFNRNGQTGSSIESKDALNSAIKKQNAFNIATRTAKENPLSIETVQGPVQLNNTLQFANRTLDSLTGKYGGLDPAKMLPEDKLMFNEANRIVTQKGNIGFDEANSTMKLWEDTGYKNPPQNKQLGTFDKGSTEPIANIKQFYRQLNSTIGQDIDQSIGQWKNDSGVARKAWQQSQQAITERRAIFGGESATNAFLDDSKSYIPQLNNALRSPKALDDVLRSGKITLPNGELGVTDTKQKIAGYALNKLLNESTTSDVLGGVAKFNTSSFAEKWLDPSFQGVKNKLFTPGAQSSVEQILQNVNTIDAPGGNGTLKYLAVHKGGLALSSAVVGGLFGGPTHGLESGAIAGGLILGGTGLAKILSNPAAARVLVAMSAGKIPEGMTRNGMDKILKGALNGAVVYGIGKTGESTQFEVNHEELVPK